jgi:hypothetical protein
MAPQPSFKRGTAAGVSAKGMSVIKVLKPPLGAPSLLRTRSAAVRLPRLGASWSSAGKWCGRAKRPLHPRASSAPPAPQRESCGVPAALCPGQLRLYACAVFRNGGRDRLTCQCSSPALRPTRTVNAFQHKEMASGNLLTQGIPRAGTATPSVSVLCVVEHEPRKAGLA